MMITTIVTIALCISCQVEMTKQPMIATAPEVALIVTAVSLEVADSRGVATKKELKVIVVCSEASMEGASTELKGYPTGFT